MSLLAVSLYAAVGRSTQRPVAYDLRIRRSELVEDGRASAHPHTLVCFLSLLPFCPQATLFNINHLLYFFPSTSKVVYLLLIPPQACVTTCLADTNRTPNAYYPPRVAFNKALKEAYPRLYASK